MLQQYDPRNENLLIYIDGELYPREEAKISVFDSAVQGGDAVWEGLRVYDGRVFSLDEHLERLQNSAHAMAFRQVPSNKEIKAALFKTLQANGMRDETHVRLTLTRGKKITSGMDPRLNQFGPTLIIVAEWKPPVYPSEITLVTSSVRRNSAMSLDSKIHHNNLINNILAKIEANHAGADAGLMLDKDGFVSEANGVNVFCVRNGTVYTPHADSCLPGITRQHVINLCREQGLSIVEKNLSLTEFYTADQVFTTGTMGELTKVAEIDGRAIRSRMEEDLLEQIKGYFRAMTRSGGEPLPF